MESPALSLSACRGAAAAEADVGRTEGGARDLEVELAMRAAGEVVGGAAAHRGHARAADAAQAATGARERAGRAGAGGAAAARSAAAVALVDASVAVVVEASWRARGSGPHRASGLDPREMEPGDLPRIAGIHREPADGEQVIAAIGQPALGCVSVGGRPIRQGQGRRAATEDVSIYRVIGARAPKRPSARARGRTIET